MWARRSLPQPWPPTTARVAGSSVVRESPPGNVVSLSSSSLRSRLVATRAPAIGARVSGSASIFSSSSIPGTWNVSRRSSYLPPLGVFLDLVEVEELLPRVGELLVGGDDRHEGAEGQVALDHEVAADGVEEERRDLGDEVVGELDEELQAVDQDPDPVDLPDPLGVLGPLEPGGVVGVDLADPAHHLPDALGESAGEPDPLLLPRVELALQLRDEPHLHRVQRDGGHSEDGVLDEHEDQQGDEHPALERGQGDGIADVAAERIGLGDDGGDQLALRGPAEPRQREAQHAHEEVVAQAPEHALADDPAVDVEEVLEATVDEDEREETPRTGRGGTRSARARCRRPRPGTRAASASIASLTISFGR